MTRKLASLRKISSISPIEGADKIELATVDGWEVVVAKDANHYVGELVVYFEIDSLLPEKPQYEFLRKNCYVQNSAEGSGFRLKTIKLRGQISQGLILPFDVAFSDIDNRPAIYENDDLTEILGIRKYERSSTTFAGDAKGNFPSFIPKTDEDRIQNCFEKFKSKWEDHVFEVTMKLDGTSFTAYLNDGQFGVCSRNLELKENDGIYWQVARKYKIEESLRDFDRNIAIQGEIMGPGVQGNKEKFDSLRLFVFNIYDIKKRIYFDTYDRQIFCALYGFRHVPIIDLSRFKFDSVKDVLDYAEGESIVAKQREGVVFKSSDDPNVSFKAISNKWLLKNE